MKIGLVIYGSINTISGGYLYDREMVKCLEENGDQVEIISIPWRNYFRHLGDNFSFGVLKDIKSRKLDILIQDELNHPSLFLMNYWLKRQVSFPIISLVHHLRSKEDYHSIINGFYRWVERIYLSSVDGFIFNSNTTKATVAELHTRFSRRQGVVATPGGDRLYSIRLRNGVTNNKDSDGQLRILFLGNITPRKGLHVLLEALMHLPSESWFLNIVGDLRIDTAYAAEMQEIVFREPWGDAVSFLGVVSDADAAAMMQQSHVLVVPSFYEGFGIVYLEAMGFGLPCIGTTAGGAKEIIVDGDNGYLIAPGDSVLLAQRLMSLLSAPDLLHRMSENAIKTFSGFPGWGSSMMKIREFLNDFKDEW